MVEQIILLDMSISMCKAWKSIVIPAFGRLTGGVEDRVVARMMRLGNEHSIHVPRKIDWDYVKRIAYQLSYL